MRNRFSSVLDCFDTKNTSTGCFWGYLLGFGAPVGFRGTCWASGHLLGFGAPSGFRGTCWASGHLLGFGALAGLRGTCWASGHLLGFGALAGLRGTCWASEHLLGFGALAGSGEAPSMGHADFDHEFSVSPCWVTVVFSWGAASTIKAFSSFLQMKIKLHVLQMNERSSSVGLLLLTIKFSLDEVGTWESVKSSSELAVLFSRFHS